MIGDAGPEAVIPLRGRSMTVAPLDGDGTPAWTSAGVLYLAERLTFTEAGTTEFEADLLRVLTEPVDPDAPARPCFLIQAPAEFDLHFRVDLDGVDRGLLALLLGDALADYETRRAELDAWETDGGALPREDTDQ